VQKGGVVPHRDIVVIGASAGGVEALLRLVQLLPPDLPAAVLIVVHTMPGGQGLLAGVLARRATLPVAMARHDEPLRRGRIYVAPPDRHLLVHRDSPDRVILSLGPTHNRSRPAIDPLFESAARAYGPRVVGIVLTGFLDDGSYGLAQIQECGGYTIVQDPQDATVPAMPMNALRRMQPDECLPLDQMGELLDRVCREHVREQVVEEDPMADVEEKRNEKQDLTSISCPECHGVIAMATENGRVKFECQVGHSFTPDGLLEAQSDDLERALWAAVRALNEGAALSRKLATFAEERKRPNAVKIYKTNAEQREEHARVLREFLEKLERADREPEILEESGAS
jgi:two-component system, chemotaxis family, protein-glutamate methylesterase/glutaminase